MALDAMLAMLQVNIAVGILYWALRAARYRERLFDRIVAAFRETPWDRGPVDSRLLGDYLLNEEFAKKYRRVLNWRRALPISRDAQVEGSSATMFSRADSTLVVREPSRWARLKAWVVELPLTYRWFRADLDKSSVMVLTVLVPVALMWLVVQEPHPRDWWCGGYAVLLAGQGLIAVNILLGMYMVRRNTSKFNDALSDVVIVANTVTAEETLRDELSPHIDVHEDSHGEPTS